MQKWDEMWNMTGLVPSIEHCISNEQAQLRCGDIPFFMAPLEATECLMDAFEHTIAGVRLNSAFRRATCRLGNLNLDEQIWFIRASLGYSDGFGKQILGIHKNISYLEIAKRSETM